MRALAYEVRRLRGLRSTWLILGAVLLSDAAVAAMLTRQLPLDPLSTAAALRAVTAAVPLLPLPLAALGAGVLGALSYGHEVRHPGLPAGMVSYRSRLRLLVGKLVVLGAAAALLALLTVLLDAAVLRFTLPPGIDAHPLLATATLTAAARPLGMFAGLAVLAGWAGLLITSLVRSAAAGVLVLGALTALLEPSFALLLRTAGQAWPGRFGGLAFQSAAGFALAALLLGAALLGQLRRRSC